MADEDRMEQGVIKIVELVGISPTSFSEAARQAVTEASKTIRGITGIEVTNSSAKVDDGQIVQYSVTVRLAFKVDSGGSAG